MDFEEQLIHIIEHAGSPTAALHAAAEAIARDELSDACGVFLIGPEGNLALWARSGDGFEATREQAESVAREALARVSGASGEHGGHVMIAAPLLSHARPIGALVVERSAAQPYASAEVRRLVAIAAHIAGVIEGARMIEMIEHAIEPGSLEALPASVPPVRGERVLQGIAASSGAVIGRCVFRQLLPRSRLRLDVARGHEVERARLRDAVEMTRNDLKRVQAAIAGELGEEHALVFAAHLMLLGDPMLLEHVERWIDAGASAAVAVDRAQEEIAGKLVHVADAYLRERVEDLEDLCSRIVSHLLGNGAAQMLPEEIVVSRRVTSSLVVELHGRGALGIASEIGGWTSHAVLLARAIGLPVVTGVTGLLDHAVAGEPLVIDGDQGRVILAPSEQTLAEYRNLVDAREQARTEFAVYRDRPPVTADGLRFALRANVAFAADIEVARSNNAEGIGLYRTEFPFIVRDAVPTVEDQARIYTKAYQAFPNDPIIFRILDLAADKLLPGSGLDAAIDAFHGYRSIRVLFDHPYILRDQVQAFAIAAQQRPLSILIPMVTSIEDLRRIKQMIASALAEHPDTAACHAPRIGVLIEVPAAIEIAADLARESDFISIGTNDLMQYALVIDRDDPRLFTPLDAYHPAVFRMLRRVVVDCHAAGKEVSVCGEMAARFELAFALIALGVDVLSVTPRAIPELKQKLARVAVAPLRRDMERILALSTAVEVEQAIRAHAG